MTLLVQILKLYSTLTTKDTNSKITKSNSPIKCASNYPWFNYQRVEKNHEKVVCDKKNLNWRK